MNRMKKTTLALGTAALLLAPGVPASATTAETCHPPNYDTRDCVCRIAVTVLELVTGDEWYCMA